MKSIVITLLNVLMFLQVGYSQKIDEYSVRSIAINDSDDNAGVSFYTQNYLIHTLPKKGVDTHDTDFYVSLIDENSTVLKGELLEGNINSYINEIDFVFTTDMKKVYFTRSYIDNNKKEHFDLYVANVSADNIFSNIKALPINYRKYSTAHPSLSLDNKTLYFSSNRKEAIGGFDIFKVAILENGKKYGRVVNLGTNVNSKGDETTPFIMEDRLFYSSNGRGGYGKFDVFSINVDLRTKARNLGKSLNSSEDDYGYIRKIHRNFGYFVSNRAGGKGKRDIYYFNVTQIDAPYVEIVKEQQEEIESKEEIVEVVKEEPKQIEVEEIVEVVKEEPKQIEVEEIVEVVKEEPKQIEVEEIVEVVKEEPKQIEVEEIVEVVKEEPKQIEVEEVVEVVKEESEAVTNTVIEKVVSPDYIEEITYKEKKAIADNVYDFQRRIAYNTTLEETGRVIKKREEYTDEEKNCVNNIEQLDDIYFDLDKFNIRPDAQIQVNKAIHIMEKCPNLFFRASSFTDSRGSSEYNRVLSQRRANSVISYILKNSSITSDRIVGIGFGESGIKNSCYNGVKCSKKEHQVNRRTEIEVTVFK